jgi:hypothetical protein
MIVGDIDGRQGNYTGASPIVYAAEALRIGKYRRDPRSTVSDGRSAQPSGSAE